MRCGRKLGVCFVACLPLLLSRAAAAVDAPNGPEPSATPTATVSNTATVTPTATPTSRCCVAHAGLGCDGASCEACVCGLDAFCCNIEWDDTCALAASEACAAPCPCVAVTPPPSATPTTTRTATPSPTPQTGSNCCNAHGGKGCDRASCQGCVCGADVFCCVVNWDADCAARAAGSCALQCPCVTAGVSGSIRYYTGARPVGSVSVNVEGAATSTSTDGAYAISDLEPGTLHVVPRKLGDLRGAVGSLDAAFAIQSSIGSRALTADQRLACDVTGNGSVTSLDAARITQLVLGILPRFPAADLCGSDWAFVPDPVAAANQTVIAPGIAGSACTNGSIRFNPLLGNVAGQNFRAVLFGDCTGNWTP